MVTRVIAFIRDKSDYKSELSDLKQAALASAIRNDLRVAKIAKKSLVDYYKEKMDNIWFDGLSHNSIVTFRDIEDVSDTRVYNLDIDNVPILEFINMQSLPEIPHLNAFVQRIHKIMNKPLFIAFVDFEDPDNANSSRELIKNLKIIQDSHKHVVFARIEDNETHSEKKKEIGITWEGLPSFAYSNSGLGDQCVFPQIYPLTINNLNDFIKACLQGKFDDDFHFRDTYESIKK